MGPVRTIFTFVAIYAASCLANIAQAETRLSAPANDPSKSTNWVESIKSILDTSGIADHIDGAVADEVRSINSERVEADGTPVFSRSTIQYKLDQLANRLYRGQLAGALSDLVEHRAASRTNAYERRIWNRIQLELTAHQAHRTENAKGILSAAFTQAKSTAVAARTPGDCNAMLDRMDRLTEVLRQSNYEFSSLNRDVSRLEWAANYLRAMEEWMAGVAESNSNVRSQAENVLLNYNYQGFPRFLTRKQLDEKLPPSTLAPGSAEQIRQTARDRLKAASMDDLPLLHSNLVAIVATSPNYYFSEVDAVQNLRYPLGTLAAGLAYMETDHPTYARNAFSYSMYNTPVWAGDEWASLLNKYDARLLATSLGVAEEALLDESKSPMAMASAMADEAFEKNDWPRLEKLLAVLAEMEPSASEGFTPELAACRSFLAGQRLEAAGRIESAIVSYEEVLKYNGKRCPHVAATEAIKRLTPLVNVAPASSTP